MSKLCIEAGKYYRTSDGQKVGPMLAFRFPGDRDDFIVRSGDGCIWSGTGIGRGDAEGRDLIAEWSDLDLTTITTPFGLLDAETQAALKAHGGPWEYFGTGGWSQAGHPHQWHDGYAYRVKPAPPKPRERWAYGAHMHDTLEAAEKFRGDVDRANPGNGYLDEPITRWVEVLP